MRVAKGISEKKRELLDVLHRKSSGPFTVAEAATILGLGRSKAKRLLAHFAARGWLSRIRWNTYAAGPLENRPGLSADSIRIDRQHFACRIVNNTMHLNVPFPFRDKPLNGCLDIVLIS